MDDHLTRQEVSALIDAQGKVATQLVLIAERLASINVSQEKIAAEFSNGLPKKISEPMVTQGQQNGVKLDEMLLVQREIKWVARCIGILVGLFGFKALAQVAISLINSKP
jgi:hypothetical protein